MKQFILIIFLIPMVGAIDVPFGSTISLQCLNPENTDNCGVVWMRQIEGRNDMIFSRRLELCVADEIFAPVFEKISSTGYRMGNHRDMNIIISDVSADVVGTYQCEIYRCGTTTLKQRKRILPRKYIISKQGSYLRITIDDPQIGHNDTATAITILKLDWSRNIIIATKLDTLALAHVYLSAMIIGIIISIIYCGGVLYTIYKKTNSLTIESENVPLRQNKFEIKLKNLT